MASPGFKITHNVSPEHLSACLCGCWDRHQTLPDVEQLFTGSDSTEIQSIEILAEPSFQWDSLFSAWLLKLQRHCDRQNIQLMLSSLPDDALSLHQLATAVPPAAVTKKSPYLISAIFQKVIKGLYDWLENFVLFLGDIALGIVRVLRFRSDARLGDFFQFLHQAGPAALPIVTLLSFLVGMILAYLGTVQLRQFGAEVYVADLVGVGMVREMGALMTAIIMAGRTGAAYAAQLGTMQVNEEVDALTTLGIKTVDYLVLPRMLALIVAMPLLTLYSDILGMLGGGAVALSMDITFTQYVHQLAGAFSLSDVLTGLFKSLVFAILISFAGCQAGLACGRSSAAVGKATTTAVVTAIVYLVVADAGLNILYFQLGI
ncbi:MlaE family ABC transporter permease [Endozoicomonas arenosclerae]|uniref:MlaE family ABC transporter permease n=1 Tax=Endozoicomonas arenosclerae TaxID=1633495 RepID=UPI000783F984|nr:ABC transporter permease [Endozoicomonas arenosclerae]